MVKYLKTHYGFTDKEAEAIIDVYDHMRMLVNWAIIDIDQIVHIILDNKNKLPVYKNPPPPPPIS
jgi:hypothetical protein